VHEELLEFRIELIPFELEVALNFLNIFLSIGSIVLSDLVLGGELFFGCLEG